MLLKEVNIASDLKLDFLHLEEKNSTNVDIFVNKKYKPALNNYSRFLVSFDDGTLLSQGVADVALGYTFSVYREIKGTNNLEFVAKLGDGSLSMTDFNVTNDNIYRYYIFKEDESAISSAVRSNDVETCWWNWSVVDVVPDDNEDNIFYADANNIWLFDLNLSSASQNQNLNSTVYNNLTKFPKVSIGTSNYASGSLSCLLGSVQNTTNSLAEYIEPATLLDEWNDFCSNGNMKLLKDRKGNAKLIFITSTNSQVDDISRQQINTINFEWVQVMDTKGITIIGGQSE